MKILKIDEFLRADAPKRETTTADDVKTFSAQPKTKKELKDIIKERIEQNGINCDLNDIDVSRVTDMHNLFNRLKFNGDISQWDVSNVEDMSGMFGTCPFNGDISKWDVSNVEDMSDMFQWSKFDGDISGWVVKSIK